MIRADRRAVAPPRVLVDPKGRGASERARAEKSLGDHLAAGKPAAEWSFKFGVYSDDEVKQALEALFHRKCAYCESPYGPTQPVDVEHWRPKNQIVTQGEPPAKPAYWWLAMVWENLLPSCIDCNRQRNHVDAVSGEVVLAGKLDQFPLPDDSPRATEPDREDDEDPLLLNPCDDDPAAFLRFNDEAVVEPAAEEAAKRRRARESIAVYALNRSNLVHARKEHLRQARLRLARIRQLERVLEQLVPDTELAIIVDDLLFTELRELARMRRSTEPYALQARQLIDRWMDELVAGDDLIAALASPARPGRAQ